MTWYFCVVAPLSLFHFQIRAQSLNTEVFFIRICRMDPSRALVIRGAVRGEAVRARRASHRAARCAEASARARRAFRAHRGLHYAPTWAAGGRACSQRRQQLSSTNSRARGVVL